MSTGPASLPLVVTDRLAVAASLSVMVGLTTAKGLALAAGKPLIAVNHLKGHALTARLTHGVDFPFLLLLASGGHCQLLGVGGTDDFRLYGTTIDDAVGEAFDKAAKILGLPYPGGPALEAAAKGGNPKAFDLPRPLVRGHNARAGADFSFSGLKTALRLLVQRQNEVPLADACASFQAAVIDILTDRCGAAMAMFARDFPDAAQNVLVMAGGVAANQAIGEALHRLAGQKNFQVRIPPPRLCTDNAAMIAWAGLEMLASGGEENTPDTSLSDTSLAVSPRARWPLASGNPR